MNTPYWIQKAADEIESALRNETLLSGGVDCESIIRKHFDSASTWIKASERAPTYQNCYMAVLMDEEGHVRIYDPTQQKKIRFDWWPYWTPIPALPKEGK